MLKKLQCLFLVLSFLVSTLNQALECQTNLVQTFSPTGLSTFRSRLADRAIVYDFKSAKIGLPTWVFMHGMGYDMQSLQAMEALAEEDGYGILRVDFHFHGKTLKEYRKSHDKLPRQMHYRENTEDVRDLIDELGLRNVVLVGHSYGGAITYDLAHELTKRKIAKVRIAAMLGPYSQRIDKYLRQSLQSPKAAIDKASDLFEKMPYSQMIDIMFPLSRMMNSIFSSMALMRASYESMIGWDQTNDLFLDPLLDTFMEKEFRKHFLLLTGKREDQMTPEEAEDLNVKVEAAIKVTKGIRTYDLLDPSIQLPKNMPPILLIGGENDTLVVPQQVNALAKRFDDAHQIFKKISLKGDLAGHLFPITMARRTYFEIRDYLDEKDSEEAKKTEQSR
jgi:pimeloyl-ACP methyl ester carboxylesterase